MKNYEGSGHDLQISAEKDGKFSCSFAKPSWAGDHSGKPMYTVQEAIVISVVEYLVQVGYYE